MSTEPKTQVFEVMKSRISANMFDTTKKLKESEIVELIDYATEAPSSFNIQHWRFIAVTDQALKEKLKAVAYGQPKVADAAVTFIVLGDTKAHEKFPEVVKQCVEAKVFDAKVGENMVGMATGMYEGNAQNQRDEAIRSASMAAMNLMLAAQAKGLVSGPMIGFDPAGVKKEFDIPERYVPVMLLTVGYPAAGNWPRKPRLKAEEVLAFNRHHFPK